MFRSALPSHIRLNAVSEPAGLMDSQESLLYTTDSDLDDVFEDEDDLFITTPLTGYGQQKSPGFSHNVRKNSVSMRKNSVKAVKSKIKQLFSSSSNV